MTPWTIWTDVSIFVLTAGAVAVFLWFLIDIVRIRREILEEEEMERTGSSTHGSDGRGDGTG